MTKKTLAESLKEVLGKTTEVVEAKTPGGDDEEKSVKAASKENKDKPKSKDVDADADGDDEKKSVKDAKKANKGDVKEETLEEVWKATTNDKGEHVLKHKSGKVSAKSYGSKGEAIDAAVRRNKNSGAFKEELEMAEKTEEKIETPIDETTAADSLHPAAAPGMPMSKIEMMSKAIGAMSVMSPGDLTSWFTKAIENSKHYSSATDGKADGNRNSLDMKPSAASTSSAPKTRDAMPTLGVKEDVEEALAGFELTEETRTTLTTIFEAAVTARVLVENVKLEEDYEARIAEAVEVISEDLSEQVDNYLTYVVEHFMKENEVAIESSLRNELASEFIAGIKGVFENFVEVPESKVEVVEALTDKISSLEAIVTETLEKNTELEEALVEINREKVVDGFVEGLALSEADKFLKLAEGVSFDGDLEAYSKKLSVIKEQYFGEKKVNAKSNINEETFEGVTSNDVTVDPNVARYMASIDGLLKK